jgi:iron complex outermembrane receptor protein
MQRVLVYLFAVSTVYPATSLRAQSSAYLEVTATKIEEDLLSVPSVITVIHADDLARFGVRDLSSALALAGGTSIARGSDEGPAGSVPEVWGLREVDAFLLLVDGVPCGGAFNPQTTAIDLTNIERIEVVRGSAPVTYGATAISGVINIIHRHPEKGMVAEVSGGSFGSASAAVTATVSASQSISADYDRQRFRDDRTGSDRGHLLYRAEHQTRAGRWQFDIDALRLLQDPASPRPREGRQLSPRVPIDSNHNPADARVDGNRLYGSASYSTLWGSSPWTTTFALTLTTNNIVRGFLRDLDATDENAEGFGQRRSINDLYVDSHLVRTVGTLRLLMGADYLGGSARATTRVFGYQVGLTGANPESSRDIPSEEELALRDRRNFAALYAQSEWKPTAQWRVDAGVRLNHARESRRTRDADGSDRDDRATTRANGFFGISRQLWSEMTLFADYRNTFKPAAIDFGPDSEADILEPERSQSYELGAKGRRIGDRLFWQASAFLMNIENLLIAGPGPLPGLQNGGKQRFRGAEIEVQYTVAKPARLFASYSRHDARFRDFVQTIDGVPTQLSRNRIEMSARDLASIGCIFGTGNWNGSLTANYVGPRFLNKRNTAIAGGYTAVDAGIGHSIGGHEIRLDVRNLTNRRDPIAESELGDAQYYLMPARSVRFSYRQTF